MIGKTVLHYSIVEKLGEGGMGVVYKARDTKLDRDVALKFLPPHIGTDEAEKGRFIIEAKAASGLDHGNICSIYAIEEPEDGPMFIVMAYYEGMSLKEIIERGPLRLEDIVSYTIQIASGLRKAHEKKIVHRDLKPANIFLTDEGQIKIIDFGLAKVAERSMLTKSGTTLGTVPYMSPEQAQGNAVDWRTDIWSLGAIIYEMITGQRPFRSDYESAVVYSIVNENPEPVTGLRSGVPLTLESIVHKCLEKDPAGRYQHVDEIIVDLRRVEKELSGGTQSKSVKPEKRGQVNSVKVEPPPRRIHPLLYSVPILLLLLIGFFYFIPDRPVVSDIPRSVAVLPLENLSPNPDDAFFAAGIHEDIIIQLSRIGDIQVIARSSVMGYTAGERNVQRISNELGVQTILEGSIRRDANRVRVGVTLTDVVTNRTLWADTFDRDLTDIFSIQSEIALEIARALEARLSETEQRQIVEQPTRVAEAYELYLRAREYFNRPGFTEDQFHTAIGYLERAVELDPEFAHAYALLSRSYIVYRWFGYDSSPEVLATSLRYAELASELQPDLPEVHIAMGYYYYYGHRAYDKALHHFNIARRFQPNNAEIISSIGFVERRLGRFDDSIQNLKTAINLDPKNLNYVFNNGQSYLVAGRYTEANTAFETALTLSPNGTIFRIFIALNDILWKGETESTEQFLRNYPGTKNEFAGEWLRLQFIVRDYEGMIRTIRDVPQDFYRGQLYLYSRSFMLGLAHDYLGDSERAQRYYEEALAEYTGLPSTYNDDPRYRIGLGRTYAGLGMEEEAIEHAETAIALIARLNDALDSNSLITDVAMLYAKIQKPVEATEILREVLSTWGFVSVPRLRVDPAWDPIRVTPEFRNLLLEFDTQVL
jgi:serine/threonine protein kinase/tetratricopeptide (TPR) repeat protein